MQADTKQIKEFKLHIDGTNGKTFFTIVVPAENWQEFQSHPIIPVLLGGSAERSEPQPIFQKQVPRTHKKDSKLKASSAQCQTTTGQTD